MVRVADPVAPGFDASTVQVKLPVAVGVPLITPVELFRLSQDGSPVALKLVGDPVAEMV